MSLIQKQFVLFVTLTALVLLGCGGSKEEEAEKSILKGDTFYQNQLYSDALVHYESALEVFPTRADLHLRIGMCREELGRFADAIRSYEIALRGDPKLEEAYRRKGQLLIRTDKVDEAETFAEKVIGIPGAEGVGFYLRGLVARAKGDQEKAIEDFEKSLELDPDSTEAEEALVKAYHATGQTRPAIQLLEKLLEKKPEELSLVAQLAFLYEAEGNIEKAISLISGLIGDHPENARLRSALARLYLSTGKNDLAEEQAREALSLDPDDASALFVSGSIAFQKGDLERAYEDLKAAQERLPADEQIRKTYREVQIARGKMTDPVNTLKAKVQEEGESPQLSLQLAEAYLFTGDAAAALAELQKVLANDPENKQARVLQAHCLLTLGNRKGAQTILEELGDVDDPRAQAIEGIVEDDPEKVASAVEALKQDDSTRSWGRYFSGVYKLVKGNLDAGISELDEAFEADESFGMPMDELARLYISLDEPGIASNIYNRLRMRFPDSPRPPMMIARLLDKAGKTDSAIIVLDGLLEQLPDFQPARFFMATLKLKQQDYRAAIQILQELIDATRDDPAAQLIYRGILAKAYLFSQDYAHAIEQYDEILRIRPDFPVAMVEKALAEMANGQPESALATSAAAVESATAKTIPQIVHSILLQQNGKVVEALEELEEVDARIDKESGKKENLIPLLASLQISAGQFDPARETIRRSQRPEVMKQIFLEAIDRAQNDAIDLGPMAMGYLFGYYNWPDPAIAIHRDLLEKYPKIALMVANLGEILQQAGRDEEAYEVYSEALKWAPENVYFLRSHAKLASRIERYEEAMVDLLKLLAKEPNDPALHFQLGMVYENQDLVQDAISSYRRVLEMNPEGPLAAAVANNLAWLLSSQDEADLDEALKYAKKALELSPENPRTGWKDANILDTLGWIHFKRGELDEASKHIGRALKTLPYQPTVIYHMARVYEETGQPRVAAHLYQKALAIEEDFEEAGDSRQRLQAIVLSERDRERTGKESNGE